MPQINYFEPHTAAERYAKGRPVFHSDTISRIKQYICLNGKLDKALDIACGTGLSTVVLLAIAQEVYGTDTSAGMLQWAQHKDIINYSLSPAEKQPFPSHQFALITVCSGVHWFNIDSFLKEVSRLLMNDGWLVLYDNFFISEMDGVPTFSNWYPDIFLKKFPAPARNNTYAWTNDNLEKYGLQFIAVETFKNSISFTKQQLILYFTTQSNITAAVESGLCDYVSAEQWLNKELAQFFESGTSVRTVNFGNWIKYIRRCTY